MSQYSPSSRENLRSLSHHVRERERETSGPFCIKAVQLITRLGRRLNRREFIAGWANDIIPRVIFVYRQSLARSKDASGEQEIPLRDAASRLLFVLAFPARVIYDRIFARLDNLTGNVLTET